MRKANLYLRRVLNKYLTSASKDKLERGGRSRIVKPWGRIVSSRVVIFLSLLFDSIQACEIGSHCSMLCCV